MTLRRIRLAVLLSGTGRTLDNLLQWQARGDLLAEVVCVASNRAAVRGLEIASSAGIQHASFLLSKYADRRARDRAVFEWMHVHGAELVILAGYLALLDLGAARGLPVLNIHPALLPRHGGIGFHGRKVHAAVLEAGDRESGCTVHRVDGTFDRGPVLAQSVVDVHADDDIDALAARVFGAECELYPSTINRIARGELRLK